MTRAPLVGPMSWHGRGLAVVILAVLLTSGLVGGCMAKPAPPVLRPLPQEREGSRAFAPVTLPRDDAPHDNLTEWWYYTGHLDAADGRRYGFELVFFQTIRGDYPVLYLGQFAVTDAGRGTFRYDNRLSSGRQGGEGFDLEVGGWRMGGRDGADRLSASLERYSIDLQLRPSKGPVLHDEDGVVSFGPAGDSYYYSRTRLFASGVMIDHGERVPVLGEAWFDHQWGDFLVLGGGWDWYAVQLEDGTDIMLNQLRDDRGQIVGVWGSLVDREGSTRPLRSTDFDIEPLGYWTSPASGATYPMGWRVVLRDPEMALEILPLIKDQELVTGGAGPTYWEGAADVRGVGSGRSVRGRAYVEMTGYAAW